MGNEIRGDVVVSKISSPVLKAAESLRNSDTEKMCEMPPNDVPSYCLPRVFAVKFY